METKCKRFCSDKLGALLFGIGFVIGHCINSHISMYCAITGIISIVAFYAAAKTTEKMFLKGF